MHDVDRSKGFRIGYGAGGGDSSAPIGSWNGPSRMKTDSDYQLKYVSSRQTWAHTDKAVATRETIFNP